MTLTRADMGTWLINLPRAVERRQTMEARLAAMGLPHTLSEGVDGKARATELLQTVDVALFERNHGRRMLPDDLGCYHAHLEAWRAFLQSGKPVALILEDDVVFHDDFLAAVDLALKADAHWDMLKLNKVRAKLPVCQGRIGPYVLNAYAGPATGLGAYLIKRETAERLLPRLLPITCMIDYEIPRFFAHDFRLFGLEPFPSHQDDGKVSMITGVNLGDIEKFRWYRRLPYYRKKAANYFRRIWWLVRKGYLFPRCRPLL